MSKENMAKEAKEIIEWGILLYQNEKSFSSDFNRNLLGEISIAARLKLITKDEVDEYEHEIDQIYDRKIKEEFPE